MKRFVFSRAVSLAMPSIAAFFVFWLILSAGRAAAQAPEVFGFTPVPVPPNADLTPYTKWTDMIRRMKEQKGWEDEDCASSFGSCPQREWRKVMARAKGASPETQLDDVNRFLNRFDYVLDAVNWGGVDYWETPKEFFLKGGECKDYAISKYFTLRILGWAPERLWMIILQDMNLNVTHAVLAAKLGDKTMILDNQVTDLVEQSRIRHYRPIFGLSEAGWVIYRPATPQ
jgi:predicted transglutaminase-like cysteine proteinase